MAAKKQQIAEETDENLTDFAFPQLGVVVKAATLEEATEKAKAMALKQ